MIDIWSDIWVGNWLDKVKEQNQKLFGPNSTILTPQDKAEWKNYIIQYMLYKLIFKLNKLAFEK